MPVVRKTVKGKAYWRVRICKKPELYVYYPQTVPIEIVRKYGEIARRYMRGEADDEEVKQYPELLVKLRQCGVFPDENYLTIGEAAEFLGVSYTTVSVMSLGAMYPLAFEIINGRRYFTKEELLRWARNFKEKGSRNPWAWTAIPELKDGCDARRES